MGLNSSSLVSLALFLSALLLWALEGLVVIFSDTFSKSLAFSSACCRLKESRGRIKIEARSRFNTHDMSLIFSNIEENIWEQNTCLCLPYKGWGAWESEADLFNGSGHYLIIGLDRRMDHQFNLHIWEHRPDETGGRERKIVQKLQQHYKSPKNSSWAFLNKRKGVSLLIKDSYFSKLYFS